MTAVSETTELIQLDVASFPRVRLFVAKGPDKGAEVILEGQTVVVGSDETCNLVLTDSSVSRRHFELSGGPGGYRLKDLKSTNGVFIEGVQVLEGRLVDKARIVLGRTELRFEPERAQIQWPLSSTDHFGEAFGRSTAMRRVFAQLEKAATTDSGVVLEGETGTGKELLARALHAKSARAHAPFVALDLSPLNELVTQSDLFGHELPKVSGKVSRPGALEEAQEGTLFLDEVTALTPALQSKLAHALETHEVRRSTGTLKLNLRVVASTQKDLQAEVRAGRFREDLFFQLAVFRVKVPPLRERSEDIPGLARLLEAQAQVKEPLSPESVDMLSRHDFPGNVRELRNMVERLASLPALEVAPATRASIGEEPGFAARILTLPYHEAKERILESFERRYFVEALKASGGVITRAAQKVGLPRQSVHRMLKRLGLGSGGDEV